MVHHVAFPFSSRGVQRVQYMYKRTMPRGSRLRRRWSLDRHAYVAKLGRKNLPVFQATLPIKRREHICCPYRGTTGADFDSERQSWRDVSPDRDGSPERSGLVSCGHWMMPMLWSRGRADKISNKLAGDIACLGGSMVEHQPRLLGFRVRFPAGAFAIFSVSAKASLPISLSPFPPLPFPSSSFSLPLPFPFLLRSTFRLR